MCFADTFSALFRSVSVLLRPWVFLHVLFPPFISEYFRLLTLVTPAPSNQESTLPYRLLWLSLTFHMQTSPARLPAPCGTVRLRGALGGVLKVRLIMTKVQNNIHLNDWTQYRYLPCITSHGSRCCPTEDCSWFQCCFETDPDETERTSFRMSKCQIIVGWSSLDYWIISDVTQRRFADKQCEPPFGQCCFHFHLSNSE